VHVRRNSTGKEFHAVGPATENELSAKRLYVRGTTVQRSPDATRIAVDRQNRVDRVRPDIAALYHFKYDTLEYTVCTLSELRQAASVADGAADEMTRDVVHQQLDRTCCTVLYTLV